MHITVIRKTSLPNIGYSPQLGLLNRQLIRGGTQLYIRLGKSTDVQQLPLADKVLLMCCLLLGAVLESA